MPLLCGNRARRFKVSLLSSTHQHAAKISINCLLSCMVETVFAAVFVGKPGQRLQCSASKKNLHSPVKICRSWEPLQELCVFPPQGSQTPSERFILLQGSIGLYLNISYWSSAPHFLFHFIPLLKNLQVLRKYAQKSIDGTKMKAVLSICCRSDPAI